jgi:hypothetical protein
VIELTFLLILCVKRGDYCLRVVYLLIFLIFLLLEVLLELLVVLEHYLSFSVEESVRSCHDHLGKLELIVASN